MKLTDNYKAREVMGELLLIPFGNEMTVFNGIKTLNGVGRLIYEFAAAGADTEKIVAEITAVYDCTPDTARADTEEFLELMRKERIIEY